MERNTGREKTFMQSRFTFRKTERNTKASICAKHKGRRLMRQLSTKFLCEWEEKSVVTTIQTINKEEKTFPYGYRKLENRSELADKSYFVVGPFIRVMLLLISKLHHTESFKSFFLVKI